MIGLFDSGVGGLTVASAIRKRSPKADLIYFGDILNAPYGYKSQEELIQLSLRAMFFLREQGVTQFVAACNSVSVSVIAPLVDLFGTDMPRVIEMVGPTGKALAKQTSRKVLVVATQATVNSHMYERVFVQHGLSVEMLALPELAYAIETGKGKAKIQELIKPAIDRAIKIKADVFVFGCTHYPLVSELFAQAFERAESTIHLFDPADAVAQEVSTIFDLNGTGSNTFFVSKQSSVFDQTVERLFGKGMDVIVVDVDKYVDKTVDKQWTETSFQTCTTLSK